MYKKYMARCFSNKRFVLALFSLALGFMLFGASLYAADSFKEDLASRASTSVDDTIPVSFPVEYNSQRFLENTLDYGHIVFRSGKQEVHAWNAQLSNSKQCSSVTTEHASSDAIQVSALAATVPDKGTFHFRC